MTASYTLIVGTKNWSSWSLRPYLALRATGAPFEEVLIQLRREENPSTKDAIAKYSAAGRVPVLKIDNRGETVTVWDSLAICEALAERHPDAKLWPSNASMRAVARSHAAEMHSGFPDVRDQLSMDFVRRVPMPPMRDKTTEQIGRILSAWDHALSHHGDDGGFLFGHFSIVDCMYAPVVSRFVTYGIEVPKAVQSYMDRVMALPAMIDWGVGAQKEVDAGIA